MARTVGGMKVSHRPTISFAVDKQLRAPPDNKGNAQHAKKVAQQLTGIGRSEGTCPFALADAHSTGRLDDLLDKLIHHQHCDTFPRDPEALFNQQPLPEQQKQWLRNRNWSAPIGDGMILFSLEKMAAVLGMTTLRIYAQMRAETLEQCQAS